LEESNIQIENNRHDIILSELYSDVSVANSSLIDDSCIVVYLYYSEQFEYYWTEYLCAIADSIDIVIISSSEDVLKKVRDCCMRNHYRRVQVIGKQNRGRDISALLVTAAPLLSKYRFFCFVHDKKEKNAASKKITDVWTKYLWKCSISSLAYICNALKLLSDDEEKYGFLGTVNPICIGWMGYTDLWASDYERTVMLAKQLKLNVSIKREIQPISVGTVFWCRTDALKKLYSIKWKYADFDEEPMPNDGTISHAVERILPFVAQDAGYRCGTIMPINIAEDMISESRMFINQALGITDRFCPMNIDDMKEFNEKDNEIVLFCRKHQNVWIYGAGAYGVKCLNRMHYLNVDFKGFIETEKEHDVIQGVEVRCIDDNNVKKDDGIIVAVGREYIVNVLNELKQRHFINYICFASNVLRTNT
jgi:rhamnosyltransferase